MIKFQDKEINKIYFMGQEIKAVYFMGNQIWPDSTNKISHEHDFIKGQSDWYYTSPVIFTAPQSGNYQFDLTLSVTASESCNDNPLFESFPDYEDGKPQNGFSFHPWGITSFTAGETKTDKQTKTFYIEQGQQYRITMKCQNDSWNGTLKFNFSAIWNIV